MTFAGVGAPLLFMAKDPAFLFYPGDWLGGTMGMTFEQKGCYFELLMLQFNLGKFNNQQAKHTLGASYDAAWLIVKCKFQTDGTYYWNEKLDLEKAKRRNFTDSRKNNLHKGQHMMKHTATHMENENEDVNVNVIESKNEDKGGLGGTETMMEQFKSFWNAYGILQNRNGAEHAFCKLTPPERDKAVTQAFKFASVTDEAFRPAPDKYLIEKRFNDQIIDRRNKKQTTQDILNMFSKEKPILK